jgi:hypothetical protein
MMGNSGPEIEDLILNIWNSEAKFWHLDGTQDLPSPLPHPHTIIWKL